nr:hypothetical protein [uncultured Mediterranean phage uvMED]
MAYIGTKPTVGNFQICDAISVVNGQAAYTMQVGSVNVIPQSANHMIVSLNGTIQKPNSSFTVSGSTITFASNLATGDVIDFIQILGDVLDLGVPSDATVTAAKVVDGAITSAKLASGVGGVAGISSSADATAMTITDAEKIGIGETTPLGLVHIKQADSGQGTVNADTTQLIIEDNSTAGITLLGGTSGTGAIFFGDSGDNDIGLIEYDHGANSMVFKTNARTAITVSDTGETTIDTTAGGLKKNIEIKSNGTKAGILGCEGSGNVVVGSGDIGLKMDNTNNIYRPYNVDSGSGVDNTGDLGSSSHRFKVVYAGTGSINTSDERHKNNIADTDLGLDFVNKLKPKKYKLNDGQSGRTHYGLISQDVETLLGEISKSTTDFAGFIKTDISEDNKKDIENINLVLNDETKNLTEEQIEELNVAKTKVQNKNDDIYALRYEEFISPIIKAIQELTTRIKALEDK